MKRDPEAEAWDLFQQCSHQAFDASTLGTDTTTRNQFLKNRLWHAFYAGIDFQKRRYRKAKVKP
jgi:hypothetical protein